MKKKKGKRRRSNDALGLACLLACFLSSSTRSLSNASRRASASLFLPKLRTCPTPTLASAATAVRKTACVEEAGAVAFFEACSCCRAA